MPQLIDLSNVHIDAAAFISFWLIAIVVGIVTGIILGPERKRKWFKQRQKNNIILRRGSLGNYSLIGMPVTLEGFAVTAVMFAVTAVVWAIVYYGLVPIVKYMAG